MFANMLESLKYDVIGVLSRVRIRSQEEVDEAERQRQEEMAKLAQQQTLSHDEIDSLEDETSSSTAQPIVRAQAKVGRNDPCPCGSGKKYKHCHGAVQ